MSVYTPVGESTLRDWLTHFDLGELTSYEGISAGIENTNYFVNTTQGQFVLTLFEHHAADEVEQFIAFARHLGLANEQHPEQALPVPAPIEDRQGRWQHVLEQKPAILCPRLAGHHIELPTAEHCRLGAAALARLHLNADDLDLPRPNPRGLDWWVSMAGSLTDYLDANDMALLRDEIDQQTAIRGDWLALPGGWIHGDMFHDNMLFSDDPDGTRVGAILDLYNACQDAWIFDLAIMANDWCSEARGKWRDGLQDALLEGYQSVRPLTDAEHALWPMALRAAALRFWLSRILTRFHQAETLQDGGDQQAITKDPTEYRDKLLQRREPV